MDDPRVGLNEVDYVQAVLMRPTIYTAQGSYFEALAFLNGYHAGHYLPNALWHAFPGWLQERLGKTEGFTLMQLREIHDDDPAAIQQL